MKPSIWAALLAAAAPAWAQPRLETVVVTGNPLGSAELATPSSVLSGASLVLRRGHSLGETLDGLPGVSSSYFGPNANRPVIRGQDGDRIRVLSNAGASLDVSSLSFDHAVSIDPLVVERIEVLRGPAALLYGGSAVGGVVNAIDNRIPKARIDGLSGALEARLGGAASERAASALVEAGGDGFALHADVFARNADDLRVPAFDRPLGNGSTERRTRIGNSASQAEGGALGGSLVWDRGYLGASVDTYRNDYGIVAKDDITIQLRRDRFALAGEVRMPAGFITTLRGQAAGTDYRHQEIEGGGAVGTTFKTRGGDARFEAVHRAFSVGSARIEGTVGMQFDSARLSALGEEAFVPSTRTRQAAAFLLERWTWGDNGHLGVGVRAEQVRVRSEGDAQGADPQFGPPEERAFSPRSAVVAAVSNLSPQWQLSSNGSYTERAPTSYELYANGVHAASSAYERGDRQQGLERSRTLDLALGWKAGANRLKVGVFDSRFANYIALDATGEPDFVDDAGESFPVFAYRGVRARLYGVELEGAWRAMQGVRTVDLDARFDVVRGRNEDSGDALPRLAPRRTTVGVSLAEGRWTARAEVQHASAQNRVPVTDIATAGWTLVNLSASYALNLTERDSQLFVKLHNVGNELAYGASSIRTVRTLAPLPGRSLTAGLRLAF
ncbi:MAG: membrane receptor protein [Leptothrix sp. (in: Bacteria)]|nr:membrane receptor protein [Leptothrix sp. (in: b-proteobacteria)]